MFILSQTKDYLTKLEYVSVIGTKVIVNGETFARYHTNEDAQRVMDDVVKCVEKGNVLYKLPDWTVLV